MTEIEVKAHAEAHKHAVALRQCAIFAADAGEHIAKAMTDAADFLAALPTSPSPVGDSRDNANG